MHGIQFNNSKNACHCFLRYKLFLTGKEKEKEEVATPAPAAKATKTQSKDTPADSGSDQPK